MPTDDDPNGLNHSGVRLRNLPPQEWRKIRAELPSEPDRWASTAFVNALNLYWENMAAARKGYEQTLVEASTRVRGAIDQLYYAGSADRRVVQIRTRWLRDLGSLERCAADMPRSATQAKLFRDELLSEALSFWCACGGSIGSSRNGGKPGGPLLRYLNCVCKVAMGDDAPATETLVKFIRKSKPK